MLGSGETLHPTPQKELPIAVTCQEMTEWGEVSHLHEGGGAWPSAASDLGRRPGWGCVLVGCTAWPQESWGAVCLGAGASGTHPSAELTAL